MRSQVTFSVRYVETDAQRVVYYANHFVWFELGYEALLARAGFQPGEERPPVREACCRYLAPVRYGERVTVESRVATQDADGVLIAHRITVDADVRAEGTTLLACSFPLSPDAEEDAALRFQDAPVPRGYVHTVPIRVRFAETSPGGNTHFSRYFGWLEVGRIAYLRHLGLEYARLQRLGSPFVIAWAGCRYLNPVGFDEPVQIHVWIEEVRTRSYVAGYRLQHGEDGRLIALGKTVQTFIDQEGHPTRIPDIVRERLLAAYQGEGILSSSIGLEGPGNRSGI
ncbi:MAG: acyl-CoA thioesterase [Chloroflexia bacterium]